MAFFRDNRVDPDELRQLRNTYDNCLMRLQSFFLEFFTTPHQSYAAGADILNARIASLSVANSKLRRKDYSSKRDEFVVNIKNNYLNQFEELCESIAVEYSSLEQFSSCVTGENDYTAYANTMSVDEARRVIRSWINIIKSGDINNFIHIPLHDILTAIYVFAMRLPDFRSEFDEGAILYCGITKEQNFTLKKDFLNIKDKRDSIAALHEAYGFVRIFGDNNAVQFQNEGARINKVLSDASETNNSLPSELDMSETINHYQRQAELFRTIAMKAREAKDNFPTTILLNEYGKINDELWNEVKSLDRDEVDNIVALWKGYMKAGDVQQISSINFHNLIKYLWFYSYSKPYSVEKYNDVCWLMRKFSLLTNVEAFLSSMYTQKSIGGEESMHDQVVDFVKEHESQPILRDVASGMMWMQAYKSEKLVLQSMLNSKMEMSQQMQNRLHQLVSAGDNVIVDHEVSDDGDTLVFDISSLSWKENDYVGLFESLAFQEKALTYSLAIRDEDKDMLIPKGVSLPSNHILAQSILSNFEEEFGDDAHAAAVQCLALAGSGKEELEGVLASSAVCPQLGVLLIADRMGKKLIIKFYTLFMPSNSDLADQKQQVLSMFNKLSPRVVMWEDGLKESIMITIQQILNTQSVGSEEGIREPKVDEPVF